MFVRSKEWNESRGNHCISFISRRCNDCCCWIFTGRNLVKKKGARLTALIKNRKIEIDSKLRGIDLARQQSQKVGTAEATQLLLDIEKVIPQLSFRFRLCGIFLFLSAILVYLLD